MSRRLIIREEALDDLDLNSAYIGTHAPQASVRFLQEAQKAFEMLANMPNIGVYRDFGNLALIGLRMWPIPRFRNYLIFYFATNDVVEIVRILHGSQDIQQMFSPTEQ